MPPVLSVRVSEATFEPEVCHWVIQKQCSDECKHPLCRCFDVMRPSPHCRPAVQRFLGRHQSDGQLLWVTERHANKFATLDDAKRTLTALQVVHGEIVDVCHPWNRGRFGLKGW